MPVDATIAKTKTAPLRNQLGAWRRRAEFWRFSDSEARVLAEATKARMRGRLLNAAHFSEIERYCMFLGYPRSSHSLIGSLIDAHPEAIIAHEQDALCHVHYGHSQTFLFDCLRRNSAAFTQQGRTWTGYSYRVPGQYQGTYTRLRVIGDKRGAHSSRRLMVAPGILDKLRRTIEVPLAVLHVTRNPFDNIATMAYRDAGSRRHCVTPKRLRHTAARYFALAESVEQALTQLSPNEHLHVPIETFIADPRSELARICRFLALEPTPAYLDACCQIVFPQRHRSRDRFAWPHELVTDIRDTMTTFSFLHRYRDDLPESA